MHKISLKIYLQLNYINIIMLSQLITIPEDVLFTDIDPLFEIRHTYTPHAYGLATPTSVRKKGKPTKVLKTAKLTFPTALFLKRFHNDNYFSY